MIETVKQTVMQTVMQTVKQAGHSAVHPTALQRTEHLKESIRRSRKVSRVARTARRSSSAFILPIAALMGLISAANVAFAVPLISEIYYDAVGSDNGQGFVELYGDPGSSVDGLFIEGVNGANGSLGPTIALIGIFGPEGIFVVADDVGDGSSEVANSDQIANFDFQNGPDSIVLRDAGQVLDAVGYGSFGVTDVFAGEGNPAPDAPAGSSLARAFADFDTDDNAVDFEIREIPSPGTALLLSVPEPQPIAMLTLGLLVLAKARPAGARY